MFQIGGTIHAGQHSGQRLQPSPTGIVIGVEDGESPVTAGVESVGAQRHLAAQVGDEMTGFQRFVDGDVAPVFQLPGIQIAPLDEAPGQRPGRFVPFSGRWIFFDAHTGTIANGRKPSLRDFPDSPLHKSRCLWYAAATKKGPETNPRPLNHPTLRHLVAQPVDHHQAAQTHPAQREHQLA